MTRVMITLGRLSEYRPNEDLQAMLSTGKVAAVRINVARWTLSELEQAVAQIRTDGPGVKIVLDLGQKVRINLPNGPIPVRPGQRLRLHLQPNPLNRSFLTDLRETAFQPGQEVNLRDGKLRAVIESCKPRHSILIRLTGVDDDDPFLRNRSGVMFPSSSMQRSLVGQVEKFLIGMASTLEIEGIASSFVENAADIQRLLSALPTGYRPIIIAKIETDKGANNIGEIIDALPKGRRMIMIARGDLFVEVGLARLPLVQRQISASCRKRRVPFIVATGFLRNLQRQNLPTRAEVIDADQAARSGAAYIMLAEETTPNSANPVQAITMLSELCQNAE